MLYSVRIFIEDKIEIFVLQSYIYYKIIFYKLCLAIFLEFASQEFVSHQNFLLYRNN